MSGKTQEAFEFVGKLLRAGMDEDFNFIHFAGNNIQTTDGVVTLSYPFPRLTKQTFSAKGLSVLKAYEICDYEPATTLNETKKGNMFVVGKKDINFKALLPYHTDYEQKTLSFKKAKKAKVLPDDFVKFVRSMVKFSVKDSDHQFAASVNVLSKRLYSTNNIVVLESKIKVKMKDATIPRPLINAMLKIKDNPSGLLLTDRETIFTYDNGAFAMCPKIMDSAPDLASVFGQFKKPLPISETDLEALKRVLSMSMDGQIESKDGTLKTDTCSIKDTDINDTKLDADNLEMILNVFSKAKFGKQFSSFEDEDFRCIMAGRA